MKNKKIFLLFPLLILFTLAFSYFLSNNLKTEVKSEEEMYYDITHNPSFPSVDGTVYDMALSEDGSILYVGGIFSEIGDLHGTGATYNRSNLAAINTSDYSVTSWAPITDGEVRSIQVNGDYVYIGGSFNYINEVDVGEFARVSSQGVLDSSVCIPNIHSYPDTTTVYDISITNDYIYVAGSFDWIIDEVTQVYGLVRLNKSDCSWDSDWIPQPDDTVFDIEIYNGSIYIGGRFDDVNGTYTGEFAKLNADGTLNTECAPNIHTYSAPQVPSTVYEISITSEYIYVGGSFDSIGGGEYNVDGLTRLYNINACSWDSSWVPEVTNDGYRPVIFSISPVGEDVFVGGSFTSIGGLSNTEFSLLDGTSGDSIYYWNPEIGGSSGHGTDTVFSSLIKNNIVYVGGSFTHVFGEGSFGYGLASFSFSYDVVPTIQVNTIEDLDNMRENLFANYILTKDLDFENCNSYQNCDNKSTYTQGLGWEPIGYLDEDSRIEYPFYGTFDGQGRTISNLYINRPSGDLVGLFGLVGKFSEIKNIGLEDANIIGGDVVGSLVGLLSGTLENSYSKGTILGNGECTGGLVGVHWIEGSVLELRSILSSYSEASVSGEGRVGGLVGCNAGDVVNSYSKGSVTGDYSVGGLIGSYNGGVILNSFWDTETSGVPASEPFIGTGLTTEDMKSSASYSEWDIVEMDIFNPSDPSIWYLSEGQDYPRLYWEYESPEVTTLNASNITHNSGTINGTLVSLEGETTVNVYFQYRNAGGEWVSTSPIAKIGTGNFSFNMTDLSLATQYEYRTVVTWRDIGTEYGEIKTFTTLETPPLPTTFGDVVSNIEDIQTPSNTEAPLVLTKIGTGSITFPSGLDLVTNYNQLSTLSENLVIVYEPTPKRFRAYVNSNGASFLATHGATIKFFNVKNQLGINGLTSSNFKTLLKVSVLDDSKLAVSDTSSYYNWNNASYNQDTDILTMPVNHFSEYVLGANTGVLPSTGMSSLTMLIPFGFSILGVGVIIKSKRSKKNS